MTALRLAIVSHGYAPLIGGAERQTAALAPRLRGLGLDVRVITRQHPGLPAHETLEGVPVWRVPVPGPKPAASLAFTLGAVWQLARWRPQVIHAQELFSATSAALLARRAWGARVVATPHSLGTNGDLYRLRRKWQGERRLESVRREVDCFVAISPPLEAELRAAGVPAERCRLIPNGVDAAAYQPLAGAARAARRAELKLPAGAVVVLFCGRLVDLKRVNRLLEAWPAVRAAQPAAELLILGAGPEEAALRQMAGPGVHFLGAVTDPAYYLAVADIFTLPSAVEGLPVALLEAMAAGLPAVATPVGGVPALVRPGETGQLVPVDDAAALGQALVAMANNPEQRARLGRQAHAVIERDYSLDTAAGQLAALYTELAQRPS